MSALLRAPAESAAGRKKPDAAVSARRGENVMKPYKGSEPYIFISYAHRDFDRVEGLIRRLTEQHYRVWYDEGIDPGTEWDENIASHVLGCHFFIAMMSSNYLQSENCKDELNFARENNKNRILVYLEDVALPAGMAMRLNRIQSIYQCRYDDPDEFYEKLYSAPEIGTCRDESAGTKQAGRTAAPQTEGSSAASEKKPAAAPREKAAGAEYRPIPYKNGSYYVGPAENGLPEGIGTMYYPDGRVQYSGPFKAGKYDGPDGTYYFEDGSRYEGEWKNGRKHGQGIQYFPDGKKQYEGPYADGKRNGEKGICYFSDGSRYEGPWKAGSREGIGIIYYPDGAKKYEGPFAGGKRHGENGTYYFKDGTWYVGAWNNDFREGFGTIYYPDGRVKYEGPFAGGKKNGEKGIYHYKDGSWYEGPWKDDLRNGEGVLYHADGSIKYKGLFTEGSYGRQK